MFAFVTAAQLAPVREGIPSLNVEENRAKLYEAIRQYNRLDFAHVTYTS